jgi:prepilin-type processing-associated H-X9-DG protein
VASRENRAFGCYSLTTCESFAATLTAQDKFIRLPAASTSLSWSDSMLVGASHGGTELLSYGYNDDRYIGNVLKNPDKMFGLQGHYSLKSKYIGPIAESEVVSSSDMMAIGDGFEGNGLLRLNPIDFFEEWGNILARHQGSANVVFCDGHVESPRLKFLFEDTNADALVRWSRDHQPH